MKPGLSQLPIVRHLFDDPNITVVRRPVDLRWSYAHPQLAVRAGFNPFLGAVHIGEKSALAAWLDAGMRDDRAFNDGDHLVRELLFAVHDALHVWAAQWIGHLVPALGFGTGPITRARFEDLVFCHLLTETVATVGLDYWYLCSIDLNELCDLGTRLERGLTTPYTRRHLDEYRRFQPGFAPHEPAFFASILRAYCTDVVDGFALEDLQRSPLLSHLMEKELFYASSQRGYFRQWLTWLGGLTATRGREQTIAIDAAWKRRLAGKLQTLTWRKIVDGEILSAPRRKRRGAWAAARHTRPDWRFTNALVRRNARPSNEAHALQLIGAHDLDSFGAAERRRIASAFDGRSWAELGQRLSAGRRLAPLADDPVDLFFLG